MKTISATELNLRQSHGAKVERDVQVDGLKELTNVIGNMLSLQSSQMMTLTSTIDGLKSKDANIAKLFLNIQHLITSNNQVNKNLENLILLSKIKPTEPVRPVVEMVIKRDDKGRPTGLTATPIYDQD